MGNRNNNLKSACNELRKNVNRNRNNNGKRNENQHGNGSNNMK